MDRYHLKVTCKKAFFTQAQKEITIVFEEEADLHFWSCKICTIAKKKKKKSIYLLIERTILNSIGYKVEHRRYFLVGCMRSISARQLSGAWEYRDMYTSGRGDVSNGTDLFHTSDSLKKRNLRNGITIIHLKFKFGFIWHAL